MKKFFLTPKDVQNNVAEIDSTLSKGMMENIKGGVGFNPYWPKPYVEMYGQAYTQGVNPY